MTINKKISMGYLLVLGMLILVVLVAFSAISISQKKFSRFLDVNEKLIGAANEVRFEVRNQTAHFRGFLLYPDSQKDYAEKLQEDYQSFADAIERGKKLAFTKEGTDLLDGITVLQSQYEEVQKKSMELEQKGARVEALALAESRGKPLADSLVQKAEEFREREVKLETEGRMALARTIGWLSTFMVLVSIVTITLGLTISIRTTRTIARQLGESVSQIASASAEILATTAQVATGSSETAASVSETTTTVEEVRQTAQVSTQKAKYVSDTAKKTVQAGETGQKSMEENIAVMGRIREQMESIGESVVRLSEQSL